MALKALLGVTCVIGAFFLIQSISAVDSDEYKPDIRYPQIEIDGQQFNLTVKQRLHQVFHEKTPIWTIQSSDNDKNYEISEVPYEKRQINGNFYGDDEHMTTLLASYDEHDRQNYYDGVITVGTKVHKVIKAPERWWTRPDLVENNDKEVKTPENSDHKNEDATQQSLKLRSAHVHDNDDNQFLDHALPTFYPKILAIVDHDLYKEFEQNIDKIIEYVATFWNAVDLVYSKFKSPDIKLVITGIVIVKDQNVNLAEKNFNTEFVKDTSYKDYDASFILTKSNVKANQGQAHLGSICNREYSVALVQDNANYGGLFSATHELGHLLNIPHDGKDEAEKCLADSDNNATFMSTDVESTNTLTWSQCSRDIIQEFAKSKAAACLENYWRYD